MMKNDEKNRKKGPLITETASKGDLPRGILCMTAGYMAVYSVVFAVGFYMYGQFIYGSVFSLISVTATAYLFVLWRKLEMK